MKTVYNISIDKEAFNDWFKKRLDEFLKEVETKMLDFVVIKEGE